MSAGTRIVLVRHGETVWHAENRYAGRSDIALTALGEAQAMRLAQWARTAGLAAVYASTLQRAAATAAPAAAAVGVPLVTVAALVELDFGNGEGLTDREMDDAFPEARAAFRADPVANYLPGGEDPRAAVARGMAALEQIAARHHGGRVLVVAHNTLIRLLLCRLLGIRISRYRDTFPQLANGTLTEVLLRPGSAAMLSFNSPFVLESV